MKRLACTCISTAILAAGLALVLVACGPAGATPTPTPTSPFLEPTATPAELIGDSLRGGRLYDTWWVVLGWDAPESNQPMWKRQTSNTRSGADTWRCVECHGWDYRGKDGAYGTGSHYTGFPGIYQDKGKNPIEILAILKGSTDPEHDFSGVLDDQALIDLALFNSRELVDTTALVSPDNKAEGGNASGGQVVFEQNCTTCHSAAVIAPVANEDPWRFLHKVRFGHPGVRRMPPGLDIGLTPQEYVDLLAYTQGQMVTVAGASIAEGARLYDTWWAVTGASKPTADQPLWRLQTGSSRSGADTWRCVVCHSWDYRGKDGPASSGPDTTAFAGVYAVAGKEVGEILGILTGSTNPDHDFSSVLDQDSLTALAAFLQQGMVDTSPYINADRTANGDANKGRTLYESTCQLCHGQNGQSLNLGEGQSPAYMGTVANDQPWTFFHRVFFGLPGGGMPAGVDIGLTPPDIANLLKYAQTLSR